MDLISDLFALPPMARAFWISVLAAPACAVFGTYITLRRLAFFSHAISHSALTGLALGLTLHLAGSAESAAMQVVLIVFCLLVAAGMVALFEFTGLPSDTVMAFSFTGSVALGVVLISRLDNYRILEGALFGDILAAQWADLWVVAALAGIIAAFLAWNHRALSLAIVHESLARLDGVNLRRLNYLLVLVIGLTVAILMRQFGALLLNGLLIIPAAAARAISPSFRSMLVSSALLGLLSAIAGIFASYHADLPTGPTIVLAQVAVLALCLLAASIVRRNPRKSQPANPLPNGTKH
jgi:zinc transport system permease protein